jgi:hypothetical protein
LNAILGGARAPSSRRSSLVANSYEIGFLVVANSYEIIGHLVAISYPAGPFLFLWFLSSLLFLKIIGGTKLELRRMHWRQFETDEERTRRRAEFNTFFSRAPDMIMRDLAISPEKRAWWTSRGQSNIVNLAQARAARRARGNKP